YLLLRQKSDWIISCIESLSNSEINCFKYNTIEKLNLYIYYFFSLYVFYYFIYLPHMLI
ncbi:hypothetical protein, partial [Plasmodium yoelii yoelii]